MRMRIDLEVISSVVVEFFFEKYRIILIIWYFEFDDQYDLSLSMCFIDFFILKNCNYSVETHIISLFLIKNTAEYIQSKL